MCPTVSQFAESTTGSSVVEFRRMADALEAKGITIVDFGIGEPDFEAASIVSKALIDSIESGQGKYVDPAGLSGLREAIAEFEKTRHGLVADLGQIVVTTGSVGALSLASRALFDPGDEVLLLEPCYGPYRNLTKLTGAVPVGVAMPKEQGRFVVDSERLAAAVTANTKAIIVNTPWNPTGRVLTRPELQGIADIAEQHDLWILSDEVYSELVYGDHRHVSIGGLSEATAARTVTLNSVSKTFAMTGWRLGYCLGPPSLTPVLSRINHLTTRCATSFVQHAAITAYTEGMLHLETMRAAYAERREAIVAGLERITGVRCPLPEGTFYAFADYPENWGDSRPLAQSLLEEGGIVVTPGSAYGEVSRCNLRFSFATSMDVIEDGLHRLTQLLPPPNRG
jgi:aspartate/methionine/tyrosine aminotransferase